jgi:hypothetical protein
MALVLGTTSLWERYLPSYCFKHKTSKGDHVCCGNHADKYGPPQTQILTPQGKPSSCKTVNLCLKTRESNPSDSDVGEAEVLTTTKKSSKKRKGGWKFEDKEENDLVILA